MEKNNRETTVVEINLSDFWKVFKRAFWLLLAVAIMVGGLVYFYMDYTHENQYSSTATLYVLRTDGRSQLNSQDVAFATAIISDFESLILSDDTVLTPATKKLIGNDYTAAELAKRVAYIRNCVSVKSKSSDSRILYITATSGTKEGAARIANEVAASARDYFNGFMGQTVVTITNSAKAPSDISNPVSPIRAGAFGVAAAAVIYFIWLVAFIFDDRIDSEEKVEKRLGLTVLGSIPYRSRRGHRNRYGNRYGSYEGYYGYGSGAQQLKKAQAYAAAKEERK